MTFQRDKLSALAVVTLLLALAAPPTSAQATEGFTASSRSGEVTAPATGTLQSIPQSLAPALPADLPAWQAGAPGRVEIQPKNATTGLSLVGTVAAAISGGGVRITADRITNTRGSGTSGTLRVSLWATSSVPVFGNTITFFSLGNFTLSPLAAGFQYTAVDQTVTYTPPPTGCYYLTVALEEFQSGGFFYVDLRTFTSGGTPDGSGFDRFSFGGASCSGSCVQNTTTACVLNGRFRVTVRFRNSFDNFSADTSALRKPVTGFSNPNFETAFFYFNSSDNIELLLKMLDQGNTNSSGQPTIAVLFGTATPLRTEITITDTNTGVTKTYTSQFGTGQGGTDFTAFVK